MHVLADTLSFGPSMCLVIALLLALSFEFVNGFHDTANAVATVIYTNTLPPWVAVIWSGFWNLIGVLTSTGAVAFSVMALLPADLVVNVGSSAGFAMVFALLISAILWNLGTWYLGLPASSSHTLIGSIMGVGLANSVLTGHAIGEGINWTKVVEVFTTLLVSPLVGFIGAAVLLWIAKGVIRKPSLFTPPKKNTPPPMGIRALLVATCTGVSFAHGSNDGQKGMGLILLILVGILPGAYALNMNAKADQIHQLEASAVTVAVQLDSRAAGAAAVSMDQATGVLSDYLKAGGVATDRVYSAAAVVNHALAGDLAGKNSFREFPEDQVKSIRAQIYLLGGAIGKFQAQKLITNSDEKTALAAYQKELGSATQYLPQWIKFAVALALGLGTMIGWKRIVVTVGEKIGKEHLTYAQGASAELVAMATIGMATQWGLPVSTTHVLSSGVAGTMAANRSGLQVNTLRNLLLAWVLTLPVCVLLGAGLFSASLLIIFSSPIEKVLFGVGLAFIAGVSWWLWRTIKFDKNIQPRQSAELQV